MQSQNNELISIVIPAYNAAPFIEETIQSIFHQTYTNWEVIIVNDGSTDNTLDIIMSFTDHRIRFITQSNAGVAAARNKGLGYAHGEYIVFFDADDVMSPDFLDERLKMLRNEETIGFVGGFVQPFPIKANMKITAAADPVNEILFSNSSFATAPSAYMFRKKLLFDHEITFNRKLSSSADRFFLLELSRFTKGKNLPDEKGKLLYRVTSQSMSNNVTPGLIIDNEKFYYELKRKNLLPQGREKKFKSFYFLSLAKGFGMVNFWKRVLKYLFMSFLNHPVYFIKNLGKTIISFSYLKSVKLN